MKQMVGKKAGNRKFYYLKITANPMKQKEIDVLRQMKSPMKLAVKRMTKPKFTKYGADKGNHCAPVNGERCVVEEVELRVQDLEEIHPIEAFEVEAFGEARFSAFANPDAVLPKVIGRAAKPNNQMLVDLRALVLGTTTRTAEAKKEAADGSRKSYTFVDVRLLLVDQEVEKKPKEMVHLWEVSLGQEYLADACETLTACQRYTLVELQNVKLTGMPGGKVIVNAGELGKPFRVQIVRRVELFSVMRTGRMVCES